ncbi:Hypothetical protein PFCIRM138_07895 [Propionibacterium freudenreichii subsp. freudenreichii]|jgi:TPR repeat protein|uniref:Uncharacterized protein n=2 Tax=Propionibacterium freudenreichii TaxID=1744 RepID=A0A0B7NY08_PROFF|nr:Putative uncharacterized protein [Propionibacterium freudenreichii]CEP25582.1 Hypothetical protein PFCIRM138_07895 [Propionibacterium freudenreichii subsp. freudenreichii]SBN43156.1 Hypothetical protein PFR_J18_818 [Propionibacterium freudenreichii]
MNVNLTPMSIAIDLLEALLGQYRPALDHKDIKDVEEMDAAGEPYYALGFLLSALYMKGIEVPEEYADKIWSITDPDDVEDFTLYLGPRPKT